MILINDVWYTEVFITSVSLELIDNRYNTKDSNKTDLMMPLLYNDFIQTFYHDKYIKYNHEIECIFISRSENIKVIKSNTTSTITYTKSTTAAQDEVIPMQTYCLFQHCPWDPDVWYYYDLKKDNSYDMH